MEDISRIAENKGVSFNTYRLKTTEEAQNAPTIWITFGICCDGEFITHEIMSTNKFEKLLIRLMKVEI